MRGLPGWFIPGLFIVLFAGYCVFLLAPVAVLLHLGWAMGGDPSEYLLTAHRGFGSGDGLFPYVFPLLPGLYALLGPVHPSFVEAYAVADLVSAVLVILLAVAFGVLGYAVGRTRLAAGAAAAAAGSFPAILGEVGLGGQAQFGALILGSMAVALLLSVAPRVPPLRVSLGAGLLFGVAALAEPYTAACLVVFGLVTQALVLGRKGVALRPLAGYLALLAPPAAAVAAIEWIAGPSAPQNVGGSVLSYGATSGGAGWLLHALGFADVWTTLGYAVVLASVVVAAVVTPGLERRAGAAVAGAVVAYLIEALVVTPAVYWPRAAYFFVLPLAVATAALVSRAEVRPAEPTPRETRARRPQVRLAPKRARWLARVTAVVAVAVVLGQFVAGYSGYPGTLQFNEFNAGAVGGLSWLREEAGSVVVVAPSALTFPIAYATERPIYPAVQPFWFDTAEERSAAVFADTLTAGSSWIDAGPLEVVESGPPGFPSAPSVYVDEPAYFVPLGTVIEEEGGVYAPALTSRAAEATQPSSTPRGPEAGLSGSTSVPSYAIDSFSSVSTNGTVTVNLTFLPHGPTPGSLSVGLTLPQVGVRDLRAVGREAVFDARYQVPGGTIVDLATGLALGGGPGVSIASPALTDSPDGPVLMWALNPPSGGAFDLSLSMAFPGLAVAPPSTVSESAALAAQNVRWVVVDASTNASQLPRFERDGAFTLARASGGFDVYQVV